MTGVADSVGPSTSSYFVIPRASRAIQEPRAQSALQAFLDAATARSMTGVADSVGPSTSSYFVIPRASRAIQEPRAQSVLQAFLDAATARRMTGRSRRMKGRSRRMTGGACSMTGGACSMTGGVGCIAWQVAPDWGALPCNGVMGRIRASKIHAADFRPLLLAALRRFRRL